MVTEIAGKTRPETLMRAAILHLENRGFEEIKANFPGYEMPSGMKNSLGEMAFIPDITAVRRGELFFFEISDKSKDEAYISGKWKALAALAKFKRGEFSIFVPKGKLKFTNEVIERHRIDAVVIKMA